MHTLHVLGLLLVGFFIGNLLFAKVGRWLYTAYQLLKARREPQSGSTARQLASISVLNSGPWFLAIAVVFGHYISSEAWAVWLYVGACAAIVFFWSLVGTLPESIGGGMLPNTSFKRTQLGAASPSPAGPLNSVR